MLTTVPLKTKLLQHLTQQIECPKKAKKNEKHMLLVPSHQLQDLHHSDSLIAHCNTSMLQLNSTMWPSLGLVGVLQGGAKWK
jgi:hypothetical protein